MKDFVTQDEFKVATSDIKVLKDGMHNAQKEIKALWDALNKIKDQVDRMFFPSMEDFNLLKGRVEKLET
jgi:hypothetical protein